MLRAGECTSLSFTVPLGSLELDIFPNNTVRDNLFSKYQLDYLIAFRIILILCSISLHIVIQIIQIFSLVDLVYLLKPLGSSTNELPYNALFGAIFVIASLVNDFFVTVNQVTPGSPADQAGFSPGDIIIEFNGKPVGSIKEVLSFTYNSH